MSIPPMRSYRRSPEEWAALGAYSSPFTAGGVEFEPVGGQSVVNDFRLHETGFIARRPHWNYQNVFSPFWRLYYCLEPGHRVVFAEKKINLRPDRVVLIPDHQLFHTVGTESKSHLWMHFSHERHLAANQPIPVELALSVTERSLIRDLIHMLRPSMTPVNRYRVYHMSTALLHLLLSRSEIAWQIDIPDCLITIVRYIEEHYSSPLYAVDLARQAHLSESVFRKKFHQFRNVTPTQFILQVRTREAAHLLSATTLDMYEIAERTGFPNPAYFSRMFKMLTGKTPARFRRESRGLHLNEPQPSN